VDTKERIAKLGKLSVDELISRFRKKKLAAPVAA